MSPYTTQMEMLFCSTVVGLPFFVAPMILTGEITQSIALLSADNNKKKGRNSVALILDIYEALTEQHGTRLLLIAMRIILKMMLKTPLGLRTHISSPITGNPHYNSSKYEETDKKRPLL
ncbi:UDP-galactose/UDP-glucose transporter 4-like [Mangifera indica]|uniref:UDP-galactose/UDP-glucose transporter 4-like n=1 Tax=Mangifera indica TaxID=29780 RepID=UPI001CFC09AF|nr:UDP-galactose/UDP-glucose transporter 4-like [Mangifera indica]